ncbi:methyl-accepting chemotaxis protein [uncultured Alsobacter sp.]|uniref:methyl-accepting chemotaxis protein n=1 Tax=uncultured Alsobacter sp. TaxID=1748258 RepID=UPI0025D16AAD|nr:methyl-accepting chemotaxis protein [uncultured Alsobacter sp.]
MAEDGGRTVKTAVEAMAKIEQVSSKITDITAVIDEIAFQTNLLALNAAVEAARAGDAGKGFAVVASEVRTLAQRAGEAARDIKDLIGTSVNEVAEGVKLVNAAGKVLDRIVSASNEAAATVGDISAAASEQASGIDEMSQAIAHLDGMTQQNAALAEESSASATTLGQQVERLSDLVAQFKTPAAAARFGAVRAALSAAPQWEAERGQPARSGAGRPKQFARARG